MSVDNDGILAENRSDCILCGNDSRLLHDGLRDPLFGAPGTWSIRQCASADCRLGWVDPRPLPDQVGKLYESYYTHAEDGAVDEQNYYGGGLKKIVKSVLARLLFWRRPAYQTDLLHLQGMIPGRLLEIGCGSGSFLAAAARAGWAAFGIDFDRKAVEAARSIPGVRAEMGDLLDQGFPAASFDAIVMNNVIEHVSDPIATVGECHRLLRPGGRLVLITPNIGSLGHGVFGRYWRGLEQPRHLFLFNIATLKALARRAGFGRAVVFSSVGKGMLEASAGIAAAAGATVAGADAATLRRKRLLSLLKGGQGEWVVLVATR
ncbi:class I SAM-dependent methyltransferase [Sphingomonas bacterium]|uniref:class I SAM-dependent methyltransferase n=1 Tax=Sphingomonas bacterium TaxID=1895847 RepID=UPI0015750EEB|nr:class I SAM-dependent methyltransferase [Sphingomonas bacterium]